MTSVLDGSLRKTARLHARGGCWEVGTAALRQRHPWIWAEIGAAMLPAESWWARRIWVVRLLATTDRFLVISMMHKHCDFYQHGLVELTLLQS
jgi:hypothetical protein